MKDRDPSRELKVDAPAVLLLTRDATFEQRTAAAMQDSGAAIHFAHSTDDALQFVCRRGDELDFAIIDFEDGCHGMTLLTAINACQRRLPILVVTHGDSIHAAALAYANGATACLARPFSVTNVTRSSA